MTNEVAVAQNNLPATQGQQTAESCLKGDLVLPKILIMQGLSDLVNERKAQQGDIVRSTTAQKLGDDKNPVKFIPLTFQNSWSVSEDVKGDGKYKFRRNEPRTAKNEDAQWDYVEGGTKWKRTKVVNVFALLPSDIDAELAEIEKFNTTGELPNVDNTLLPVVISFRSTGFNAGKTVVTHFAKAASLSEMVGKPVPAYGSTLTLMCYQDKNDLGTYFVPMVEGAGQTRKEYLPTAQKWYEKLTQNIANIKFDEAEETESVSSSPQY